MERLYKFIGKQGKYQIDNGVIVKLIKCWTKRKCLIQWKDKQYITMVSLLRKIEPF